MSINYKKTVAVFEGTTSVEDAEALCNWFREKPKGKVNLKDIGFTHTAVLQLLLLHKPQVSAWPAPGPLYSLLKQHLN